MFYSTNLDGLNIEIMDGGFDMETGKIKPYLVYKQKDVNPKSPWNEKDLDNIYEQEINEGMTDFTDFLQKRNLVRLMSSSPSMKEILNNSETYREKFIRAHLDIVKQDMIQKDFIVLEESVEPKMY